LITVKAINL